MTGRIITVRHGRPALSRKVLLSATGYGRWWQRYDESTLMAGEVAPAYLCDLGKGAGTIIASTMPRAVETGVMIAPPGMQVVPDKLYVEAPLPPPPWPEWIKLSPLWWGALSRTYWTFGYAPGGIETRAQSWVRVDQIIERLRGYAGEGDVILCAHGYLNWMISRRMKHHGWCLKSARGGHKYWSSRVYGPDGAGAPSLDPGDAGP